MTLEPTVESITNVIKKLGFQVKKAKEQPKGKNDEMEVILDAREDWKNLLSLSYYSNMILMSFILDFCICYILTR